MSYFPYEKLPRLAPTYNLIIPKPRQHQIQKIVVGIQHGLSGANIQVMDIDFYERDIITKIPDREWLYPTILIDPLTFENVIHTHFRPFQELNPDGSTIVLNSHELGRKCNQLTIYHVTSKSNGSKYQQKIRDIWGTIIGPNKANIFFLPCETSKLEPEQVANLKAMAVWPPQRLKMWRSAVVIMVVIVATGVLLYYLRPQTIPT